MTETASTKQLRKPEYLSPAQLARVQGCSERTVREWCKKGVIPEAYQTRGGHWRIPMALSGKTLLELEKRCRDSPFKKYARNRRSRDLCFKGARDLHGEWVPDFVEWLMLAQLFQCRLGEDLPVPTIAELGDPVWEGFESADPRAKIARRIQDEIIRRLETGEPFWDMLVTGWVYQLSLENQRLPTLAEVAERVWLSRPALYRKKCSAKTIAKLTESRLANLGVTCPAQTNLIRPKERTERQRSPRSFGSPVPPTASAIRRNHSFNALPLLPFCLMTLLSVSRGNLY